MVFNMPISRKVAMEQIDCNHWSKYMVTSKGKKEGYYIMPRSCTGHSECPNNENCPFQEVSDGVPNSTRSKGGLCTECGTKMITVECPAISTL